MDPLHRSAYPLEFFSPLFITCWLSSSALFSFSISPPPPAHHQSSSSYFFIICPSSSSSFYHCIPLLHPRRIRHFHLLSLSYSEALSLPFLPTLPSLKKSLSLAIHPTRIFFYYLFIPFFILFYFSGTNGPHFRDASFTPLFSFFPLHHSHFLFPASLPWILH